MTRVLAFTIALVIVVAIAQGKPRREQRVTVQNDLFGAIYDSSFDRDITKGAPDWAKEEANPPVAAKRAMELAHKMRESVVGTPAGIARWALHSLSLRAINPGWAWFVNYQAVTKHGEVRSDIFTVVVLMDETVVPLKLVDGEQEKKRNSK